MKSNWRDKKFYWRDLRLANVKLSRILRHNGNFYVCLKKKNSQNGNFAPENQ